MNINQTINSFSARTVDRLISARRATLTMLATFLIAMFASPQRVWADNIETISDLQSAISSADNNATVSLTNDITVSQNATLYFRNKNIQVNCGPYTIHITDSVTLTFAESGTIYDDMPNSPSIDIQNGSKLCAKTGITINCSTNANVALYYPNVTEDVNWIYYASLADALTRANSTSTAVTIKLLNDIYIEKPTDKYELICNIVIGEFQDSNVRNITLDLNGHTLTGNASGRVIGVSGNRTSVTITDSSPEQTGTIRNNYATNGEVISNGGTLTFNAGNIRNQYGGGISNSKYANLFVTGGTIITQKDAIFNNQGTATISNCTVSGNIGINNNGDMTIGENVSIIKCSYAGLIYSANTMLNVLPDFGTGNNANDVDIRVNIPKKIVFGENFSAPAIPLANKIKVNIYEVSPGYGDPALYVFTQGYATTFTDGTTGETVDPADVFTVTGCNVVLASGEAIAYDTNKPLVAVNTASDGSITGLYAKNDESIATDADALWQATQELDDGSTLTLYKDIEVGVYGIPITKGTAEAPVTLDLNGYTITGNTKYNVLIVGDDENATTTVKIKNGTIKNSCTDSSKAILNFGNINMNDVSVTGYDAITNNGTLTVESGTITATGYNGNGLYNVGTLTVIGGSVTGNTGIDNSGTLTVSGGTIEGNSFAIYNKETATSCIIGAASIKNDDQFDIMTFGNVTLTAWPTFSGNDNIFLLNGGKIVLGDGFAVPATGFNKIKVDADGEAPLTITSGYATHCKDGDNVLAPDSVFTCSDLGYAVVLENSEVVMRRVPVITLAKDTIDMYVYNESSINAMLSPDNAGNLVYTSDDENVAKIEDGKIKAVGVGTCTITVSYPGNDTYLPAVSQTISVTVSLRDASVSVEKTALELYIDDTYTIVPTTTPEGLKVTYTADGSGVVSVDENGKVTALKGGTGSITVKVGGDGVYTEDSTVVGITVIPTYAMEDLFSGSNEWTGYVAEEDLALPDGLSAYIITALSTGTATATQTGYIPKGEPVLLRRTDKNKNSYTALPYAGTGTAPTGNLLRAATATSQPAALRDYLLYRDAFVLSAEGTLATGKVYLPAPQASQSRTATRSIIIDGDGTTSMDGRPWATDQEDGAWHDMQGRKYDNRPTKKGLYIHNGKKEVVR